jgi:hypothetical protein
MTISYNYVPSLPFALLGYQVRTLWYQPYRTDGLADVCQGARQ